MKNLMNIFITAVLIYFILHYVPSKKIPNKEILIIISIIFLTFFCYDCILSPKNTENMANVNGTIVTATQPVVTPTTPSS